MIDKIKPLADKLMKFSQSRLNFKEPPELFFEEDEENSLNPLGRTAHYDPSTKQVTIFITSRHPKDILRSLAHELVHHTQNLRGDLSPEKCGDMSSGYAQKNDHLRQMEMEAYLEGNMCFRDWEDSCKLSLAESNFLNNKEKTKMVKLNKKDLAKAIKTLLAEHLKKKKRISEDASADDVSDEDDAVDSEEKTEDDSDEETENDSSEEEPSGNRMYESNCGCTDLDGTPEKENNLYKERFSPRNEKLYSQLLKKWSK